MIVDTADDVRKVGFWIDAVELGGFNDGVEASRPLAACIGATELKLPRFRGHQPRFRERCPDVEDPSTVCL
jgi:hypothetical protein